MPEFEIPKTVDEFKDMVEVIEAAPGYQGPAAFALGLATFEGVDEEDSQLLDVHLTRRNYAANYGTAAVLAAALKEEEGLQTGHYVLEPRHLHDALRRFTPYNNQPGHGNIDTIHRMLDAYYGGQVGYSGGRPAIRNRRTPVLSVVRDWGDAPQTVGDSYLRLYALSERHREPNTTNLDGVFGVLPNVVVTEKLGTFSVDRWNQVAEQAAYQGLSTAVRVLDKFPRMLDHVVPTGVRVADPSRVRLGAYLGEGTTVMHEGFVNFNAGTLGQAMVEGRISAGVAVGNSTDIGGGVSIMGTLSGGGKERITIGESCLLEANSGTGISLGDNCRVEAGTYVKSTTPVMLPDGSVVKAALLSGQSNMMLRRNATTGVVELVSNGGAEWGGLNADLHTGN